MPHHSPHNAFPVLPALLLLAAAASAAPPIDLNVAVIDFNTGSVDGIDLPNDERGVYWDGRYWFAATQDDGKELFTSDGTDLGTGQFLDLRPGEPSSSPEAFTRVGGATSANGRLFFIARGPGSAPRIWVSDGTTGGTVPVDSTITQESPDSLRAWEGDLYFSARPGSQRQLYKMDPLVLTPELVDASALEIPTLASDTRLVAGSDRLFFVGTTNNTTELWSTDGTGLTEETDLDCNEVSQLRAAGAELFFVCTASNETSLMRWSSVAPTGAVVAHTEPAFTDLTELTFADGRLYFVRNAQDVLAWNSANGMVDLVHDGAAGSNPSNLTEFGGSVVYYFFESGVSGGEPWIATGASTQLLKDIWPSTSTGLSSDDRFVESGGLLYFAARSIGTGTEPWVTDGTEAGTRQLAELAHTVSSSDPGGWISTPIGLLFSALGHLWTSDGTTLGTVQIDSLTRSATSPKFPFYDDLSDRLFFGLGVHPSGNEPAVTDGTVDGTLLLADVDLGEDDSIPTFLGSVPDPARGEGASWTIFKARQSSSTTPLFRTDGTAEGTEELLTIPDAGSFWEGLRAGDRLVFGAGDDLTGSEPWSSDGTSLGTNQLLEVNTTDDSLGSSFEPIELGGHVYFLAEEDDNVERIWRSDGTTPGTEQFAPAADLDDPVNLARAGDLIFFMARETARGGTPDMSAVHVTDGTPGGTQEIGVIADDPKFVVPGATGVFFEASESGFGDELWFADLALGPRRITDIWPGSESSEPDILGTLGDTVIFVAEDGTEDGQKRLWSTTVAGPPVLLGTFDSVNSSRINSFGPVAWNGWIWFGAETVATGDDLWRTDGTVVEAVEIASGPASSEPEWMTPAGARLYVAAWHPDAKNEWIAISESMPIFADGFESGDTTVWALTVP